MRIGILGSGLMGAKLGTIFARAGHAVVFSYARSAEKLKKLAREANARAGTPTEAARDANAILLWRATTELAFASLTPSRSAPECSVTCLERSSGRQAFG
jgi:predicted dinucleotide-binding enzyme